ncbi:hypothetical protein WN944_020198 [Citrus x changshan-huyou]|uniref:Uncharacterized protein n=1 Tax=Citrus x changshan-huyou TaxID=2935761 RepID=A0AAP0QGL5_9ROSI
MRLNIQGLESYPSIKRITVKPQTDRWVFPQTNAGVIVPAEGRITNLDAPQDTPAL